MNGNIMHSRNSLYIHCGCSAEEVDAKNTENKKRRTSHQHQS